MWERLNLILAEYVELKRKLRSFGLRPNIVRYELEVLDPERAKEQVWTMSRYDFIALSLECLFLGHFWHRAALALCRKENPTEAAAILGEFFDEAFITVNFTAPLAAARRRGREAKSWKPVLSGLAGYVRGQLRAVGQRDELPESEVELMSFVYEALHPVGLPSSTALRSKVVSLCREFNSKDSESGHWYYLRNKKGVPPRRILGIQELPSDEVLEAWEDKDYEDLLEFEHQEALRQDIKRLKGWVERSNFTRRQQQVYESDLRNDFNTALGASELAMTESTYRTHRENYITKLREIATQGQYPNKKNIAIF
jgi:hypothetical protein